MSIQDIQADPQDTSNFYLASIHQALTSSNLSNVPLPSSPLPFTPPTYGIWVNSLWFLSLVISMTCAVLANLLQQWARKYLKVTQPRSTASEPRRARYRAFYAEGVENFLLPWVFEALPAMLHLSVFLFFAGLVVFLWKFDPTISKLILSWVAGCVTLYGYITFIPTFRHDSPYNTPLSPLAWRIVTGVPYISLRVFEWVSYFLNMIFHVFSCIRWSFLCLFCPLLCCLLCCFDDLPDFLFASFSIDLNRLAEAGDRHRKLFFQGMQKTAEKAALGLQSGLSKRAFMWTFDSSHEDEELECFFSNLPGFRKSNDDEDFLDRLTGDQKENLWSGLVGFLDRTFSSDSLLEDDKARRAKICTDALQVDPLAFPYILDSVISEDQCAPVQSAELAPFVTGLDTGKYEDAPMLKQAIVSCVIATARLRNDEWFTIASEELGVEKSDLRHYTPPDGPDLSLAILIHVTCQQLHHFKDPSWPSDKFSKVLRAASKFKVQQASPQLQNGFCSLWNLLVGKAQDDEDGDGRKIARFILRPIYKVYVDIHQRSYATTGTQFFARTHARTSEVADILRNPREYLPCTNETHQLDLTSSIPEGDNDTTSITFAHIRVAAPTHPASDSTPALALVTTAPRASSAMSLKAEPGAAAEDDGKSKPTLRKEMDDLDTPSANRAHASTPDPRSSSLPSVTDSKGADAGRSPEPNVEGTGGDRTLPLSPCGDDIV
jgi:hypothetical protein